ncbi:MAG TPA: hypothetical protein VK183_00735 [Flavobacterium sp.]|nr:hypothetical protein [Flavobacterium sp.]
MKHLLLLACLTLFACQERPTTTAQANPTATTCADERPPYKTFVKSVHKWKNASYQAKSDYLFQLVNDDLYCYWKGTPWDFYGMTRQPQQGQIACGYFVTNTLADLGFRIERIRLAQVASGEMIRELCTNIKTFNRFDQLETFLKSQPDRSVFIIGLDFHTGYIVKDGESYFLHSNYLGREGVIKEPMRTSRALVHNKFFMIGSLSQNKAFVNRWFEGLGE